MTFKDLRKIIIEKNKELVTESKFYDPKLFFERQKGSLFGKVNLWKSKVIRMKKKREPSSIVISMLFVIIHIMYYFWQLLSLLDKTYR